MEENYSTLVKMCTLREMKNKFIPASRCYRYMYWTDWGEVAKIEKAGMDGQGRVAIIDTDLIWPNGLALDYDTQTLYWADANLDKIEYATVDGSGRTLLETSETGLLHPYSLTIHGDLLYWTDWQNNSVFATHKIHGEGGGGDIATIVGYLVVNPNGIEAVGPDKQPSGEKSLSSTISDAPFFTSSVISELLLLLWP